MENVALLVIRVVFGLVMAGHGAQKLFGWFGGHGLAGTSGWLSSLGLKPAPLWALAAGTAEFGGGVLIALGLLNPLGPVVLIAAMVMAILLAHLGKGLWATSGGSELPLLNIAAALALIFAGPGTLSLDAALGIQVPGAVVVTTVIAAAAGVLAASLSRRTARARAGTEA